MGEELKARARQLRREGLSVAQIAERLGGRSRKTVQGWVFGVPPPEWTRRPLAKDAERDRARELRLAGLTYTEIATELGVSKSSISLWTRDLPHPKTAEQKLEARLAGARRYFDLRRRRVLMERQHEKQAWADAVGPLSDRELVLAGAVAYWAEGAKSKPWRATETVSFINSDAGMIRLFLAFLHHLDVPRERLRFRLQIHESADLCSSTEHWAEVAGVPIESFQRPTLKRHLPLTNRKNVGAGYHGCLVITVLQGARLYRRIEGTWWAVARASNGR